MSPRLSLIITAVNEADNLSVLVPRLIDLFAREGVAAEIIVVDGHSTDGTADVAARLGCRVQLQSGPGYAQAIRDGIAAAGGDYVIVMDGDLSHAPEAALRLFQHRHQADIVINSRYVAGGGSDAVWWRDALSRLLNLLYRRVLDLPYREISGGFRLYRREVLERVPIDSRFYEVQEEILVRAHGLGFRALEIPYRYRRRGTGSSKARPMKHGLHLLYALLKFRRHAR